MNEWLKFELNFSESKYWLVILWNMWCITCMSMWNMLLSYFNENSLGAAAAAATTSNRIHLYDMNLGLLIMRPAIRYYETEQCRYEHTHVCTNSGLSLVQSFMAILLNTFETSLNRLPNENMVFRWLCFCSFFFFLFIHSKYDAMVRN